MEVKKTFEIELSQSDIQEAITDWLYKKEYDVPKNEMVRFGMLDSNDTIEGLTASVTLTK